MAAYNCECCGTWHDPQQTDCPDEDSTEAQAAGQEAERQNEQAMERQNEQAFEGRW